MSNIVQKSSSSPSPDAVAVIWIARRCRVSPSVARLIGELRGAPVPISADWLPLATPVNAIVERLSTSAGGRV